MLSDCLRRVHISHHIKWLHSSALTHRWYFNKDTYPMYVIIFIRECESKRNLFISFAKYLYIPYMPYSVPLTAVGWQKQLNWNDITFRCIAICIDDWLNSVPVLDLESCEICLLTPFSHRCNCHYHILYIHFIILMNHWIYIERAYAYSHQTGQVLRCYQNVTIKMMKVNGCFWPKRALVENSSLRTRFYATDQTIYRQD